MSKYLLLAGVLLCPLTGSLMGCKEDAPPPPLPPGESAGSAAAQRAPLGSAQRKPVQLDEDTVKVLKLGSCVWGAVGVAITRDAYLASTKDGEPSAEKLPSFGEFPEFARDEERRKKSGREEVPRMHQNLPYVRHLKACQNAKHSPAKLGDGLDEALAAFETYTTPLSDVLSKANRYYAKDNYTKDEFKEGKQLHGQLAELLPKFDETRAPFVKAWAAWYPKHKDWAPKDELRPTGVAANTVVMKAQEVVVALIADKRDKQAIDAAITAYKTAVTELETAAKEDTNKRNPHHGTIAAILAEFTKAVEAAAAIEGAGKLTLAQAYAPMSLLGALFEGHFSGIQQALRARAHAGPLKVLNPGGGRSPAAGDRRIARPPVPAEQPVEEPAPE